MQPAERARKTLRTSFWLASGLLAAAPAAWAGGEVTSLIIQEQPASASSYDIAGETYRWGTGVDQLMDGFVHDGSTFRFLTEAGQVKIQRVDQPGISTGTPCSLFAQRGDEALSQQPTFPGDGRGEGNCDMARMLKEKVVNRGALNVFSNVGEDRKNIERVDFVFANGITAPLQSDLMSLAGHLVSEKRGNNPVQMAAILALGADGQPTGYGPLVRIGAFGCSPAELCYGLTPLSHNYSFFHSNALAPNGAPAFLQNSTETEALAFVSLQRLGLAPAQRYQRCLLEKSMDQ